MNSSSVCVCFCYIFYCVVCLRVGKTGYYCLLDSMELLLSLWLNKSKARPFAWFFNILINKRPPLDSNSLKRLSVCVCVWVGKCVIVVWKPFRKILDCILIGNYISGTWDPKTMIGTVLPPAASINPFNLLNQTLKKMITQVQE